MPANEHLIIGGLIFEEMDQADFTGPFEVLSRLPDSEFHVIGKSKEPVRDVKGLVLTPELSFAQSPQLDVLLVPHYAVFSKLVPRSQGVQLSNWRFSEPPRSSPFPRKCTTKDAQRSHRPGTTRG